MWIDLNCDLGEGVGNDADLLPLITSANVACNAHAGSPEVVLDTLRHAVALGVVVGAHPGHADRAHFGRRELPLDPADVTDLVRGQIDWLRSLGADIRYVKPHGGLYHQANHQDAYADALIAAAGGLPIVGLPGSQLASRAGAFVAEGYADRRYRADGSLVPRSEPDAMILNPAEGVRQVLALLDRGVRTVCVHGDHPDAIAFVVAVRAGLRQAGVGLRAFA